MMFGYASDETPEYMPYPIALAHKLSRKLTEVRKNGTLPYLRPDGKTQVTVEYDENGVPARLDAVVLSTQHDPEVTQDQIHKDIKKYVFDAIIPEGMVSLEKTVQRLTVLPLMQHVTLPRILLLQDLLRNVRFSCLMQSV